MRHDAHRLTDCLAATARATLLQRFEAWDHRPSAQQLEAIDDLLRHLELSAAGHLEASVYVSAIPAGTGKSAALAAFASALVSSPAHRHVGALILVNRIEEVREMATALADHRGDLGIICGLDHGEVLKLGAHREDPSKAQVIISTQEALRRALRTTPVFNAVTRYHYRGTRRAVVCWDEAIAFNRPVTLSSHTITDLGGRLGEQSNDARRALLTWGLSLDGALDGPCTVPDFKAMGVDFQALEASCGANDELASQARALGRCPDRGLDTG